MKFYFKFASMLSIMDARLYFYTPMNTIKDNVQLF
ncbi:hypothetical protein SAMN05421846_101511 [Chryseobacterium taeanense]|uniref:Uncharacterized protein n=1 Tax=Chryseobacterium taeanense TaxID=311334 RepID=A0A1G8EBZ4_9FLAO|nr:hypothetical protein SAMN05421846_101511 [Chryseobacterium taeanense]